MKITVKAATKSPFGAFDPLQTRQVQELKHTSPLIACRFDPTGRYLVTAAQDNTLQRWELSTGKQTILAGHASWVRALAFASNDLLISGDYHGQFSTWRLSDEVLKPLRTVAAHNGWIRAVATSPDGRVLATCGNDHLVKLWSTADGKLVREFVGHTSHVYNVAFHPSGQHLASADLKGVVKHWDLEKGTVLRDLDAGLLNKYDPTFRADIGGIRGMAFSRDGSLLACCGITDVSNAFAGVGKPIVVLFDWASGKRKQLLRPKEEFQGTAWGVAFHPAGFIVAAGGGNGGGLWFWKPDQPVSFHSMKLAQNARDLDLHPDGTRLAVAQFDNAARVFDLTTPVPAKK